jgi:hypothetical protein
MAGGDVPLPRGNDANLAVTGDKYTSRTFGACGQPEMAHRVAHARLAMSAGRITRIDCGTCSIETARQM